jgi:hypothetical protein
MLLDDTLRVKIGLAEMLKGGRHHGRHQRRASPDR